MKRICTITLSFSALFFLATSIKADTLLDDTINAKKPANAEAETAVAPQVAQSADTTAAPQVPQPDKSVAKIVESNSTAKEAAAPKTEAGFVASDNSIIRARIEALPKTEAGFVASDNRRSVTLSIRGGTCAASGWNKGSSVRGEINIPRKSGRLDYNLRVSSYGVDWQDDDYYDYSEEVEGIFGSAQVIYNFNRDAKINQYLAAGIMHDSFTWSETYRRRRHYEYDEESDSGTTIVLRAGIEGQGKRYYSRFEASYVGKLYDEEQSQMEFGAIVGVYLTRHVRLDAEISRLSVWELTTTTFGLTYRF